MRSSRSLSFASVAAVAQIRARSTGIVGSAPGWCCRPPVRMAPAATPSAAAVVAASAAPTTGTASNDATVQYVVVRRDLGWPAGSVAAQAVHACVAAVWRARDNSETRDYCNQPHESSGTQMHTVVLETMGADSLVKLASRLKEAGIDHVLWEEHPENIVTALAARPYPRSVVQPHFRKFRLFK